MRVKIKGVEGTRPLSYYVKGGVDAAPDIICIADNDQFQWDENLELWVCTLETYEWWTYYFADLSAAEALASALAGIDEAEVDAARQDIGGADLGDQPGILIRNLAERLCTMKVSGLSQGQIRLLDAALDVAIDRKERQKFKLMGGQQ